MIAPQGKEIRFAGLESPAWARNRRKATVKIRRDLLLRYLFMVQVFCLAVRISLTTEPIDYSSLGKTILFLILSLANA